MSGYLARLAARAQGAQPAAGPRPLSIFEGAPSPAELPDEVFEVTDERMPASGAFRPAALSSPSAQPSAQPLAAPIGAVRSGAVEPGVPMAEPLRDAGDRHPSTISPSTEPEAATATEAPSPAMADRGATAETALSGALAALADVAREPVPSRPQASERALTEPATAAPEPDVVHVTIGRVDVRTSIANAAPPAPAPRAATPDKVLSLHDYLRGERAR